MAPDGWEIVFDRHRCAVTRGTRRSRTVASRTTPPLDARRHEKFNRTENIRPIPPGDPDFTRLFGRRNDAESINRALDDTLWLRRAHSLGHARQHLNLITHAAGTNALAVHLHQTTATSDPPADLAA